MKKVKKDRGESTAEEVRTDESTSNSTPSKYDVVLANDKEPANGIPDFSVYFGTGFSICIKQFRKKNTTYVSVEKQLGK